MSARWREAFRAALPPAAIALAMTLLRLAGERLGWSDTWFSRETAGIVPSRLGWVVGITWLALPFGAWLAWRRLLAGDRPASAVRGLAFSFGAALLVYGMLRGVLPGLRLGFPGFLFPIWGTAVLGAWVAWRAWPGLARPLLAYGLLSRLPVAMVMFLALRGHWGTHYDYVGVPFAEQMPFWPAFLWLAFVPQLVFWVAYTVVVGMVAGTVTAALLSRRTTAISIISISAAAWLSSAAAAGAAPPPVPTHAAAAERVRAREQAFARTMAERDLAAFAGFVSQEAVFLGRTVLRGRATVVEGWKPLFEGKKPPFSWQPETVEVIDSGTLAISRGPVFDADGKRSGTFTSTWRLETDGEWRVLLDSGCPPCACP